MFMNFFHLQEKESELKQLVLICIINDSIDEKVFVKLLTDCKGVIDDKVTIDDAKEAFQTSLPERSETLPYEAFVEALMKVAKKLYPTDSIH